MTGQELFHALSFVDERYIMEAETARLSKTPWIKILSVAACLCILITGVYAYGQTQFKGAMEMAPAADAPAAAAPKEEALPSMQGEITADSATPVTIPGELHHVSRAQLQVVKVLEEGSFEAIVTDVFDAHVPFAVEDRLMVVIDPDMIPAPDRTDGDYAETVEEDMLIEIQNGAYDAGINTLYTEGIMLP